MSANDVLDELTDNRLKASIRITSTPLLVWPMVTLTGDDAAKFQRDEQSTDTYRGKSFAVDGGLLAPYRVVTPLTGGHILDLPMTKSNRDFLQRLRDNPVPVGKRLCLPCGTLLEIPDTGDYFVTVDELNMPDVFCEIVIRTPALREFEIRLNAKGNPAPTVEAVTPAPVALVEPATPAPVPLITSDIAFCFAGLKWSEKQWKKPLGDKPKWLLPCIAIPGVQGVSETRWNPVSIGAALVHKEVKINSVRAKFQTINLLTPWLEEWKTYEADNFNT